MIDPTPNAAPRKPRIFASVGSMLPFDRFTKAIDAWAHDHPNAEVFIQIGDGTYEPEYADWARMLPHTGYLQHLKACDLFVAHVGIGSIVQALEIGKQMLALPRLASLGEHTTEHQLHTADRFRDTVGLEIVDDVPALLDRMTVLSERPMVSGQLVSRFAPTAMTAKIQAFFEDLVGV
jgi:UDP-N-acetylglucosamine transferase subunit ALG13